MVPNDGEIQKSRHVAATIQKSRLQKVQAPQSRASCEIGDEADRCRYDPCLEEYVLLLEGNEHIMTYYLVYSILLHIPYLHVRVHTISVAIWQT